MNKIWLWFYFSCKRQLTHLFFLLLLLLLPLGLWAFSKMEQQDSSGVSIALYSPDEGLPQEIFENLVAQNGAFDFYIADSEQALIGDVESQKAECGYIFYEGFEEKLNNNKYKRSIALVSAPSTVADKLSTEVFFAGVMEVYGKELLYQYLQEGQVFSSLSTREAWEQLEPLYDQYLDNGSTFSFEYVTGDSSQTQQKADGSLMMTFPVRGVVAVYVFVISLFSAVMLCDDEKKGLFIPVPYPARTGCKISAIAAPVFLSGLSGLVAIWLTKTGQQWWLEVALMAAYVLAASAAAFVLRLLVRQPMVLCSLIPFLTIASLVVCPVFADLSAFVPVIKTVRLLFLPYYYLQAGNIFF